MNFLLDTHVLLWWLNNSPSLSKEASRTIQDSTHLIFVSAATAWEISIKRSLGKLKAPDNLEEALLSNRFQSLSITLAHTLLAGQLPFHHRDPFDRLLVAQSKIEGLTLITRDKKQMRYDIRTIAA